jgi:hypothetical protein
MKGIDLLLQLLVIGGFGLYAYSALKRQSIRDTFQEIKELFQRVKNG